MPKKTQPIDNEVISESYISIGLGLLVVVVVGILLYNYFTQKNKSPETENNAEKITQEATMSAKPGTVYTVVEGDNLWNIAETSYKSGFNWVDIAKANNISESGQIEVGQQLVIPESSPIMPLTATDESISPETKIETITGNSYVVVEGDSLWNIACRSYGDCYAWTRIAETNKLTEPNIIHPGNILNLPR